MYDFQRIYDAGVIELYAPPSLYLMVLNSERKQTDNLIIWINATALLELTMHLQFEWFIYTNCCLSWECRSCFFYVFTLLFREIFSFSNIYLDNVIIKINHHLESDVNQ